MNVYSSGHLSQDLVVRVQTPAAITDDNATALGQWIARVVSRVHPTAEHSYGHVVVAGTENYEPVDSDSGMPQTQIVLCVHDMDSAASGWVMNSVMDNTDLVVQEERDYSPPVLNATAVADFIESNNIAPPFELSAVGVSAVGRGYASEVWGEIVSVERNWMDGSGKGFMVHPMWIGRGEHTIREMSFNFGWGANYAMHAGQLESR